MILHPFDASQFCPLINKKRILLNYNVDKLTSTSFEIQDEYWSMCLKEEFLCSEDEYKYHDDKDFEVFED